MELTNLIQFKSYKNKMKKILFQPITNENFQSVIQLSDALTDEQKKCVASNVKSLAQAYLNPSIAWPRAIYLEQTLIGFIMLDLEPDDIPNQEKAYFLWRFMMGRDYQGKGYGKYALNQIVHKCIEDKIDYLYTSCDIKGDMPYQFYIKYGFVDTGVLEDDEEILKLEIASKIKDLVK